MSLSPHGSRVYEVFTGESQAACQGLLEAEVFAFNGTEAELDAGVSNSEQGDAGR